MISFNSDLWMNMTRRPYVSLHNFCFNYLFLSTKSESKKKWKTVNQSAAFRYSKWLIQWNACEAMKQSKSHLVSRHNFAINYLSDRKTAVEPTPKKPKHKHALQYVIDNDRNKQTNEHTNCNRTPRFG